MHIGPTMPAVQEPAVRQMRATSSPSPRSRAC
jgi:hypothetical protein